MVPPLFPKNLHYSSLSERKRFYSNFDEGKVFNWLRGWRPTIFLRVGLVSNIFKKELEEFKNYLIQAENGLKEELLFYLPESVYYHRRREGWGEELVFDLDPENVSCDCERRTLHSFCKNCFSVVKDWCVETYEFLKSKGFNDLRIVFSGRGFHVHVWDETAWKLKKRERVVLSEELLRLGVDHDEWVSSGGVKLIRLPYSLNGIVNKVVTPISVRGVKKVKIEEDFIF